MGYDSPSEEEPRVSLEDQFAKGGNSDPQEGTKKKQRQDDKNQSARRSRDKITRLLHEEIKILNQDE